jgi:VanZ family protein
MGFAFGGGYSDRRWSLLGGLVLFAGAIELAQLWIPGRHSRASDFFVNATAACIGLGLGILLSKVRRNELHNPS